MRIFVGNLSFDAKDADVYNLFMPFGSVTYVSIVMDKKGKESRGFAFLDMPDELQAQAAIAALNAKDFMGRPLNVEPSRPKPEGRVEAPRLSPDNEGKGQEEVKAVSPFAIAGKRRIGRRTRSFIKKRIEAGVKEPFIPKKKYKENPMRWRKKKPWEARKSEPKPWEKAGVKSESKPWQKNQGGPKPWQKNKGEPKPWEKSGAEPKPWQKKSRGKPKPWEKSGAKPKPRQKSDKRKKPFHFKGRGSPGPKK
ncbi:MAG: RNA-binding protein [Candidatus Omnitrophota bacterium]